MQAYRSIEKEIEAGQFVWSTELEDVHMNIEARLTDQVGIVGKKLHTGRSRNDQVATDIRLWLRDEIDLILSHLTRLQEGLLGLADEHAETHYAWLYSLTNGAASDFWSPHAGLV